MTHCSSPCTPFTNKFIKTIILVFVIFRTATYFSNTIRAMNTGYRYISRLKTSTRRQIGGAKTIGASQLQNLCPDEPIVGNVEMDSHADTCVLGKNFIILHASGRVCDVFPFTQTYEGIEGVQIVTGATAWTCPETGETYILVVPEGLWMPDNMPHSLVNPNQLRAYGSTVQDNPFAGPLLLSDPEEEVRIPMSMDGTNIVFSTRTPSQHELDHCRHVQLCSDHEWNPALFKAPMYSSSAVARESITLKHAETPCEHVNL